MVKKTKKPIGSLEKSERLLSHDDVYANPLKLSDELKAELDEQGLVGRFVDYKNLKEMDGMHRSGWVLYKRKNSDIIENQEFRLGSGPDGAVRRGTCILAVKTKEAAAKQRAYLDNKAARQKAIYNKQAAEELKQMARDARLDTSIVEGYEE